MLVCREPPKECCQPSDLNAVWVRNHGVTGHPAEYRAPCPISTKRDRRGDRPAVDINEQSAAGGVVASSCRTYQSGDRPPEKARFKMCGTLSTFNGRES